MNYILSGEESYLIRKKQKEIINGLHVDDMNVVFYNATKHDMADILNDCNTLPFFSDQKVVIIDECTFLGSGATLEKEELLLNYVKEPLTSTTLVLVYTGKIDARKKIGKELKKYADSFSFQPLEEYDRKQLVEQYLNKHNVVMTAEAKQLLFQRLNFDMTQVFSELDKLIVYGSTIERNVVDALIQKPLEEDVFQLSNAIISKHIQQCFHLLKDFKKNNVEIIALIALIATQFRFLSQVKILDLKGYGKAEIAKTLNAHPYRVEKTLQNIYGRDLKDIQEILMLLAELDQNIKKGLVDKQQGFELLLLQHCL